MTDRAELEDIVGRAMAREMERFQRKLDDLKHDTERAAKVLADDLAIARKVEAQESQRSEMHAAEDRANLLNKVREDIERVSKDAAKSAVTATMKAMGLDPEKPADFILDMAFIKSWREATGKLRQHAYFISIGLLLSAIATGIGLGAKAFLTGGKP